MLVNYEWEKKGPNPVEKRVKRQTWKKGSAETTRARETQKNEGRKDKRSPGRGGGKGDPGEENGDGCLPKRIP